MVEDAGSISPFHSGDDPAWRDGESFTHVSEVVHDPCAAAGIGRALAKEFLSTGDNVIVSSRSEERVRSTVKDLEQLQTGASVAGIAANVSKPNDVAALANFASTQLGTVDLWCVFGVWSPVVRILTRRRLTELSWRLQDQQRRQQRLQLRTAGKCH